MRIDDPGKAGIQSNGLGRTQGVDGLGPNERSQRGGRGGGADQVELSDFAAKVKEAQRDDSAERAGRIEELRRAVAAGTYRVEAR
ncbi:MAG TPA: hypothetical protein DEH78_24310, partial [Solibacterales bacterium]|nr:hypothetical protein [Bryobacterales bacterium]